MEGFENIIGKSSNKSKSKVSFSINDVNISDSEIIANEFDMGTLHNKVQIYY